MKIYNTDLFFDITNRPRLLYVLFLYFPYTLIPFLELTAIQYKQQE